MDFFCTTTNAARQRTACAIVGVYENKLLSQAASEIDSTTRGMIKRLISRGDVSAAPGSTLLLTDTGKAGATRILLVGLGLKSRFDLRTYIKALNGAAAAVLKTGSAEAVSYLGQELEGNLDAYARGHHTSIAFGTAMYRFHEFKSSRKPKAYKLRKLGFGESDADNKDAIVAGAKHGAGTVRGMDLARDLGNMPPNVCTPSYLAECGRDLAQRYASIDAQILDESDMAKLGMNSLLSVGHGSAQASRLIVLEYRGGANDEPPIALVGKGITFDTG
ncbi:MAG: M17 family peptidase N-terminal domain-containing protein, partial [Pseudomonadota bacterium]